MSIYPHVPYFYIIQHIPSGKLYGGSKWERGCHPDIFMTPDGYHTSSEKVKDLIKKDGLESFKIILIIPESECFMSVYDYETVFLQSNDIANNIKWINRHNNDGYSAIVFGSPEHKSIMIDKFGVENPFQSEEIKDKIKATILVRFGVEHAMQNDDVKAKCRATSHKKYGVEYATQSNAIKVKVSETNINKFGVENPFQSEEIKDKIKAAHIKKLGVSHPMKSEKVKDKCRITSLANCGFDHISKSPERRLANSILRQGSQYYNDGNKNYLVYSGNSPEPHWIMGMKPRKKKVTPSSTSS